MEDKNNNEVLFTVENSSYIAKAISYFVGGMLLYLLTMLYERSLHSLHQMVAIGAVGFGLMRLLKYNKVKEEIKLQFMQNEIIHSAEKKSLSNIEIKEIYRISSIIFEFLWKLRLTHLGKLISILIFPILLFSSLLNHLAKSIYYRKKFQFYDYLVIIGKNDKEVIKIQIPLQDEEEQKKLEVYFKEYLNTDIKQLPRLWFVPEKKI